MKRMALRDMKQCLLKRPVPGDLVSALREDYSGELYNITSWEQCGYVTYHTKTRLEMSSYIKNDIDKFALVISTGCHESELSRPVYLYLPRSQRFGYAWESTLVVVT